MTDELKPCPFCGSKAYKLEKGERVMCSTTPGRCPGTSGWFTQEKWNTRHLSTQQVNAIKAEGLREAARWIMIADTSVTQDFSIDYLNQIADRLENTGDE